MKQHNIAFRVLGQRKLTALTCALADASEEFWHSAQLMLASALEISAPSATWPSRVLGPPHLLMLLRCCKGDWWIFYCRLSSFCCELLSSWGCAHHPLLLLDMIIIRVDFLVLRSLTPVIWPGFALSGICLRWRDVVGRRNLVCAASPLLLSKLLAPWWSDWASISSTLGYKCKHRHSLILFSPPLQAVSVVLFHQCRCGFWHAALQSP